MHFVGCSKRNVLTGCIAKPHGHLWADDAEKHDLVLSPKLTDKETAREIVRHFLSCLTMDEATRAEHWRKLEGEINASNLPEDDSETGEDTRSYLRRVK